MLLPVVAAAVRHAAAIAVIVFVPSVVRKCFSLRISKPLINSGEYARQEDEDDASSKLANGASVSASGSAPSSSLRSDFDLPLSPVGDLEVVRPRFLRYRGELDD
jgi:hypothetical protein